MEDDLDAAHGRVDALVRPQIALHELDVVLEPGEVGAAPGREVVEHAHVVTPRARSARTTFEPMKPPPPVTRVFIAASP